VRDPSGQDKRGLPNGEPCLFGYLLSHGQD